MMIVNKVKNGTYTVKQEMLLGVHCNAFLKLKFLQIIVILVIIANCLLSAAEVILCIAISFVSLVM